MGHWCRTQWSHIATMAELGLKKKEIDAIEFAFDVYDFKGDGKVDAFYAGDLIRACNLNPTLKTITEIGGGLAKGTKFLGKADIFPMYKACKDSKDQGGFHDFVEILKLYDKNGDDTMIGNELFRLLTNLGEKLTKEEAKALMRSCASPRTRRASWSSNLSWRGCALLRSKFVRCSLTCIVQYSTVLYFTALYCKVQYSTMPYCTKQYSTKVTGQTVKSFYLRSSVLRLLNLTSVSTIQYYTVLYCTVQYCTAQYSTVQYTAAMEPCIPAQYSPWGHLAAEIDFAAYFCVTLPSIECYHVVPP